MRRAGTAVDGPRTSAPLVSVVIPTRNRVALLTQALHSATHQSDVDLEVIVVDDGSSPEVRTRIDGLQRPGVRVLHRPTSGGPGTARNCGIDDARGDWIAFLDDDDIWAPSKLKRQLDRAEDTAADAVYGAAVHVGPDLAILSVETAPPPAALRTLLRRYNAMPAGSSNVLVRRSALEAVGPFTQSLAHFADWDLWLRLAGHVRFEACPDVVVAYRKHGANMVSSRSAAVWREYLRFVGMHPSARFDHAGVADWLGHNHLTGGRRVRYAAASVSAGTLRLLGHGSNSSGGRTGPRHPGAPPAPGVAFAWLEPYGREPGEV